MAMAASSSDLSPTWVSREGGCQYKHAVVHSLILPRQSDQSAISGSGRVQLLRLYCIGISILLILVETESPWLMDKMRVLDNWLGRAFMQVILVWLLHSGTVSTDRLSSGPSSADDS